MAYKTTISDTTRAYVLFPGKEERYSCRAIAKKAKISKSPVSYLRGKVQCKQDLKTCKKIGRPKMDLNDVVSCTSLGGINIRMLGFVIQVIIYILRSDQERLRKMQHKVLR
jgi:hypothetical protein